MIKTLRVPRKRAYMKLRFVVRLLLFCLSSLAISPYSLALTSSQPETRLIIEGVGVDNIIVGRSVMDDVIKTYGEEYDLIEHNKYSYEIEYEDLGLSFWYRYEDAQKRIFCIAVRPPCKGITSRGIIVGESTLQDILNIYGESEAKTTTVTETWFYEYPGVEFHLKFDTFQEKKSVLL